VTTTDLPVKRSTPSGNMADAEFGWREALRGVAELLQAFLERAQAEGVPAAKARVNVSDLLVIVNRHRENPPTPFLVPDIEKLVADCAAWKKGVEDANRISQRLKAERDEWERNARELGMNGVCGKCGGPRWASAEALAALGAALVEAMAAVQVFHGPSWHLYRDHAPEMERWRGLLQKHGVEVPAALQRARAKALWITCRKCARALASRFTPETEQAVRARMEGVARRHPSHHGCDGEVVLEVRDA
jgi:hypothetical protein